MEDNSKLISPLRLLKTTLIAAFALPTIALVVYWFEPSKSGPLGDTIGGIAGPVINFAAAILVYYSFMEQYKANQLQRQQIDEQKAESHDFQLYQLLISELKDIETRFREFEALYCKGKPAFERFIDSLGGYLNKSTFEIPTKEEANELNSIFINLDFTLKQLYKFKNMESVYYNVIVDKLLSITKNYFPDNLYHIDEDSELGNYSHYDLMIPFLLHINHHIIKIRQRKHNHKV